MTIRYTDGSVTVDLGGQLEDFVRGIVDRATTESLRTARRIAEEVRGDAAARWYGADGVTRKTGLSGQIRVVETVDLAKGEVRVSVGSADKRTSGGKPVPVWVRRPGRLSVVRVPVSAREWFGAPESMRANFKAGPNDPPGTSPPYLFAPNPKASDGKKPIDELVKKPVRKRMKASAEALGAAIAGGARG